MAANWCRSIAYDTATRQVILLLEVRSPSLRPSYNSYKAASDKQADLLIVKMLDGGLVSSAININYDKASITFGVASHSLFIKDGKLIFGGQAYGYKTRMQNVTYSTSAPTNDAFLFRLDTSTVSNCFFSDEMTMSAISDETTSYTNPSKWYKKYTSGTEANQFRAMRQFIAYNSRYSGSFDLLDTAKGRMCASTSVNLTDGLTYYKGQREKAYYIGEESGSAEILNRMDKGHTWLFKNGSAIPKTFGRFDRYVQSGTVFVYTNSDDAVGQQKTIIRGCSNFNELLEMYLYVNVMANNYPDFVKEIETSWTLPVGDIFEYKLPQLADKENNDVPEVYIRKIANQAYPPFLSYDNTTRSLQFRPDSIWYQGNTYHFSIVVKETNSDVILYPYYCAVKISGKRIDPLAYYNYTDLTFALDPLERNSTGALVFSHPINTTYVKENFNALFDVYVRNTTYIKHNTTMKVKDFKFTHLPSDNRTMNFTVVFDRPYMLGLLVKKSDRLYVHMKYYLLDTNGFFKKEYAEHNAMFSYGNASLHRIFPKKCSQDKEANDKDAFGSTTYRERLYTYSKIPLLFDFTNPVMAYWRAYAENVYWYLCGFIALQFILLTYRNVGFLPLWTMIEYMQLGAFIPLYNFKLIPYLYDVFKPLLVTHAVLTDKAFVLTDMADQYFDINYEYYWLSIARLGQALALMACGAVVVVLVNIVIAIAYCVSSKESKTGQWLSDTLAQFKFNAYIRYYMVCYFDLTFFAIMKLVDASKGNDTTPGRRGATIASYVIFTLAMVMPVFFVSVVCYRFDVMRIK